MSLTDTALKALKPKDASYIVSDDRGLYVEVLPSGSIVWRYRYRLDGKREKLTLGKYPALTLKNARLKRDEAARQVAMGESPAKRKQQEKVVGAEDATVAEFAERFFKDIQSRDRKDVIMPRRNLEKDILPHIGSKPVRDITAEDVRSVIWRKKEQGFDAAAGQVRGLLKRMFDYALTCGLIQANPVMALPMRHVYRAAARDRALTPDEIRQFLRAMQTSNIRRQFKIAFQLILMVLHGAIIVGRKGTVGSLYWENEPFFPIDTTFYVKPKAVPMTYCFYAMQTLGLDKMNTDAAVPGLNRENVYRLELVQPFTSILKAFDELVGRMRNAMRVNETASQSLAELRDTLLPKLLSGELTPAALDF